MSRAKAQCLSRQAKSRIDMAALELKLHKITHQIGLLNEELYRLEIRNERVLEDQDLLERLSFTG